MQWLGNNWIWIVFAVGMLAMHMFGHGGHGGQDRRSRHAGHSDGSDPHEAKESVETEPVAGTVSPADRKHDHVSVPSDLKSIENGRTRSDRS